MCAAKHNDIKSYIVKEKIQNHIESIKPISTKQVLADLLNKGLPPSLRASSVGLGARTR